MIISTTSLRKLSLVLEFDYFASLIECLYSANALHELESLSLACAHVIPDSHIELLIHSRDTLRVLASPSDMFPSTRLVIGQQFSESWRTIFPFSRASPYTSSQHMVAMTGNKWKGEKRIFDKTYQGPRR